MVGTMLVNLCHQSYRGEAKTLITEIINKIERVILLFYSLFEGIKGGNILIVTDKQPIRRY